MTWWPMDLARFILVLTVIKEHSCSAGLAGSVQSVGRHWLQKEARWSLVLLGDTLRVNAIILLDTW